MPPLEASVLEVETRAFRAWPAAEVEALGGWRLRATRGPTRRASSVWPGPEENGGRALAPAALAARLARVESFYRERALVPRFQLFPGAAPGELDAELERRGWLREPGASVQVASAEAVASLGSAGPFDAVVAETPAAPWWSVAGERSRFSGEQAAYRALLARLAGRVGFALACERGEPAATALGVIDGGWLGVFSMLTLPAQRRRGAARALLGALARFARARGAERLYLQVEPHNAAALALYARAGFTELYEYHYRTHPGGRGARWPRIALRHRVEPG